MDPGNGARAVLCFRGCAALAQQFRHSRFFHMERHVQRRLARLLPRVGVRACLEQGGGDGGFGGDYGHVQRSDAVSVGHFGIGAGFHQGFDEGCAADEYRHMQRGNAKPVPNVGIGSACHQSFDDGRIVDDNRRMQERNSAILVASIGIGASADTFGHPLGRCGLEEVRRVPGATTGELLLRATHGGPNFRFVPGVGAGNSVRAGLRNNARGLRGHAAHGAERIGGQDLPWRKACVAEERRIGLCRAGAPEPVDRAGAVAERVEEALRLADRLRRG